MGVRFPFVYSTTYLGGGWNNPAQLLCTTPPLIPPFDNTAVIVLWSLDGTIGTGGTGVKVQLYRGASVASPTFYTSANFTVVAGNTYSFSGMFIDTPGLGSGMQYSLGTILTGESSSGVVNDCAIAAFVL